jgi:hypothetical protein
MIDAYIKVMRLLALSALDAPEPATPTAKISQCKNPGTFAAAATIAARPR